MNTSTTEPLDQLICTLVLVLNLSRMKHLILPLVLVLVWRFCSGAGGEEPISLTCTHLGRGGWVWGSAVVLLSGLKHACFWFCSVHLKSSVLFVCESGSFFGSVEINVWTQIELVLILQGFFFALNLLQS